MSRQREREEFIAAMTTEGVRVDDARKVMRYAATLQRIANQCSSEAADRDPVRCPRCQTKLTRKGGRLNAAHH